MSGSPQTPPSPSDVQIGYQAAVALWAYEGNLIWAKFNAFLVANSVILAIYGLALGSSKLPAVISYGLPVVGLVLCTVWGVLTKRGFDNYLYWIFSARELEEQYLPPEVVTTERGGIFADGHPVTFKIGGASRTLRMSRVSRWMTASRGAYLSIGAFAVLYLALLITNTQAA